MPVDPHRWQRVKLIFERALRLPSAERLGFVRNECAGDAGLEREVLSLLQADASASGFLSDTLAGPGRNVGGPTMTHTAEFVEEAGPSAVGGYVGAYKLVDFVGSGGMGAVYRAVQQKTGRVVALKMLHRSVGDSETARRLVNEAEVLSRLNHPNIATLYDFFEMQGRPCLVMEYVDGLTVAGQLKLTGPFSSDEALFVLKRLARAIGYMHSRGVLHRDIKAENIKIQSSGEIKLLDFGLARNELAERMTRVGGVMGTLPYMAPELLQKGVHDARSDVWALGVLLYEMVIGKVPFEADSIGALYQQQISRKRPTPSEVRAGVSETVDSLVKRCLAVSPERRFRDGEAIVDAIRQSGVAPTVPSALTTRIKQQVRDAWDVRGTYLGVTLAVALVAGAGAVMNGWPSESEPPSPTVEIVDPPREPVPENPQAPNTSASAPASTVRCLARPPASVQGLVTIGLQSQGGRIEVLHGGSSVGSTPCYVQAPAGDQLSFALRTAAGDLQHRQIGFRRDHTYTFMVRNGRIESGY